MFPGKFNREASRLGDVGSEDPSLRALRPEVTIKSSSENKIGFLQCKIQC